MKHPMDQGTSRKSSRYSGRMLFRRHAHQTKTYYCAYCGLRSKPSFCGERRTGDGLHVNHIVARSHDGGEDFDNFIILCHRCHLVAEQITKRRWAKSNKKRHRYRGPRTREALLDALLNLEFLYESKLELAPTLDVIKGEADPEEYWNLSDEEWEVINAARRRYGYEPLRPECFGC